MRASGRNRRLRTGLGGVAIATAISLAGTGRAEPLAYDGSLAILIGAFGVGVPGQGTAEVDAPGGHLQSLGVAEGAFQANGLVVTVTAPSAAPVGGIQVTAHNGAGSFVRGNGGVMSIVGSARACLFGACPVALANLVVPLSVVGAGGTATAEGPINVTVVGAPWTTGTASVGTATAMGFARGPASQTSSTGRPDGELQLVTPIRILTNLPSFAELPAFGVLTLRFVPEPTTVALLGGGLAATALFGRRTRSRS
jgi:PEP-CTERM motif